MTGFEKVFHLLKKEEKRTGSDYTATVTRVGKGVAYVQIAGSEITDTPVSMSVDAKPGDQVRVRVNGGKAWLTGNDSNPPNNSTAEVEEVTEQAEETAAQVEKISRKVDSLGSKVVKRAVVYSQWTQMVQGYNHITFQLPGDLRESLGVHVDEAWPLGSWSTNAVVTMCRDGTTVEGTGFADFYVGAAQQYILTLSVMYI